MIDPDDVDQGASGEPYYGRCERCYHKAVRYVHRTESSGLRQVIHRMQPPATHRYSPPCRCSSSNCWDEYLCADCAAQVEKPQYVELLGEDDDD